MTRIKKANETAKIMSMLTKDINRIRKQAEAQTKINILRKYQISLLDKFLKKLLKEGRISKDELKEYYPRKKEAEKRLFK